MSRVATACARYDMMSGLVSIWFTKSSFNSDAAKAIREPNRTDDYQNRGRGRRDHREGSSENNIWKCYFEGYYALSPQGAQEQRKRMQARWQCVGGGWAVLATVRGSSFVDTSRSCAICVTHLCPLHRPTQAFDVISITDRSTTSILLE